jgi:hypothetical protein
MAIFKGPVPGSNVVKMSSNFIYFLLRPKPFVLDPAVVEIRKKLTDDECQKPKRVKRCFQAHHRDLDTFHDDKMCFGRHLGIFHKID